MVPPRAGLEALAGRLIAHESGGSAASAAAVDAIYRKLDVDLIDMLGSEGVSSLFRRALHLARREWPLLAGVEVERTPASCFVGLSEVMASGTDEEAVAMGVAVTAHLLELLVRLLGENLGLQPVHRWWPDVASSSGEMHQ